MVSLPTAVAITDAYVVRNEDVNVAKQILSQLL